MESMWVEKLTQEKDQWIWKPELERLDLKKDFSIDEDNLNLEICNIGQLMVRYGSLAAEQSANLTRKEEKVKLIKARVGGAIRSSNEVSGTKTTENSLGEQITLDDIYQAVLSELHILRSDALKAEHYWRAIMKKADLLNALAFRQSAEIRRMPG